VLGAPRPRGGVSCCQACAARWETLRKKKGCSSTQHQRIRTASVPHALCIRSARSKRASTHTHTHTHTHEHLERRDDGAQAALREPLQDRDDWHAAPQVSVFVLLYEYSEDTEYLARDPRAAAPPLSLALSPSLHVDLDVSSMCVYKFMYVCMHMYVCMCVYI
jgi:hypothetical protein